MSNLQINSNYYSPSPYKFSHACDSLHKSRIAFGQILPEHLFIKLDGFEKNMSWADSMIECVNNSMVKIQKGAKFSDVLKYIAKNYNDYFTNYYPCKYLMSDFDNGISPFGLLRRGRHSTEHTAISGKYKSYRERFVNFFNKHQSIDTMNKFYVGNIQNYQNNFIFIKTKKMVVTQNLEKERKPIKLSEIEISQEKLSDKLEKCYGDKLILCNTPSSDSIKPVLKHIETLYSDVTKIKKVKTQSELDFCNEKIAEIQWYFAQVTPFLRGSAGIADVFSKSVYEGLGVQVSSWKKGVAPDLEAYVRTLDDYVSNYTTFFEKLPKIMD